MELVNKVLLFEVQNTKNYFLKTEQFSFIKNGSLKTNDKLFN